MIYITGDTHGEFGRRFNTQNFPEQKPMTKDDYVIICGDFGGIWDFGQESKNISVYYPEGLVRKYEYVSNTAL